MSICCTNENDNVSATHDAQQTGSSFMEPPGPVEEGRNGLERIEVSLSKQQPLFPMHQYTPLFGGNLIYGHTTVPMDTTTPPDEDSSRFSRQAGVETILGDVLVDAGGGSERRSQRQMLRRRNNNHRRRHSHQLESSPTAENQHQGSRRSSRKRRVSSSWSAALRQAVPLLKAEKVVSLLIAACERSEGTFEAVKAQLASEPACRRVVVRNIPYLLPASDLYAALESALGEVERVFVSSKGSGVAIFGKFETACRAVCSEAVSIKGRTLQFRFTNDVINEGDVWPLVSKPPAKKRRNELLVRDLAPTITENGLAAAFAHFGDIKRVYLPLDDQGRHKGHAYVTFVDPEDALRAAQQSQRLINERMAFVTLAGKQRRSSTRNNNNK